MPKFLEQLDYIYMDLCSLGGMPAAGPINRN